MTCLTGYTEDTAFSEKRGTRKEEIYGPEVETKTHVLKTNILISLICGIQLFKMIQKNSFIQQK